jgi:hypothetical protein
MKKNDPHKGITKVGETGCGTTADMDRVVNRIVRMLRGGKAARLPGVGTIIPGKVWVFKAEPNDNR